jgi:hypothetical protein
MDQNVFEDIDFDDNKDANTDDYSTSGKGSELANTSTDSYNNDTGLAKKDAEIHLPNVITIQMLKKRLKIENEDMEHQDTRTRCGRVSHASHTH